MKAAELERYREMAASLIEDGHGEGEVILRLVREVRRLERRLAMKTDESEARRE